MVTCHPREKTYGDRTPPGPCVPHGGTPVAPQCPLPSRGDARTGRYRKGMISAHPSYQGLRIWDPETFAPGRRHVPRGAPSLGSG
jgi:hypothetical protein